METNISLENLNESRERNFMERLSFVKFWARYVRTHSDREWSEQQRVLIDSQMNNSRDFYERLGKTKEGREKIKSIRRLIVNNHKKD